jgi:adenylosuccinate synthase
MTKSDFSKRLCISHACPILLPFHIALDEARENKLGKACIGTTRRGIGPAYEDKVARRGLRMDDLLQSNLLADKLQPLAEYHTFLLRNFYKMSADAIPVYEQVLDELLAFADFVRPLICDVTAQLEQCRNSGKRLLFEGAQGTLLDIDHGTYPFVTSSSTVSSGVGGGCGFGPLYLDYILGITKAYTTRVGAGPFPTECKDECGATIAKRGNEFGATTGRPRRCGWLDIVLLKRAITLNSISSFGLTKLDVLDGFEKVSLCTKYKLRGEIITTPPLSTADLELCEPIYEEMPGWKQQTYGATELKALPAAARKYLARIEELTGTPISLISTGPKRDETIFIKKHVGKFKIA